MAQNANGLFGDNARVNGPLADLFRYNRWANLRLIEACRKLSAEQLAARAPGTVRSIEELLLHVVGAQQAFISRTKGRQDEGEDGPGSAWSGFDVLQSIAVSTSDELIAIADAMDADPEVDLAWQGKVFRYPMHFFLLHAFGHGVEHRTEIKVTMAALGVERPDLDGWSYSEAA